MACIGVIGILSLEFGVVGVLPQIASYYGIGIEKAGYLLSAFAITVAITGPFTVLYLSRFNKKTILMMGLGLFILSAFVSFFKPPFWLLIIFRILPAMLHPIFFATTLEAASEGLSQKLQIRNTSIVIGGIAIAQVTVIPLTTYAASMYGWPIMYLIQGSILLIALLSIYLWFPSLSKSAPKSYGSQLGILKRPRFIAATCFNLFLITSWFATYSYFADYLIRVKGMSEQQVSYMLLVFGIAGYLSNFVAGRILGRNLLVVTSFYLLGLFIIPLLLHFTSSSITSVAMVVCIWGIMYGPCFLLGIFYMASAAQDAKKFANSIQASFGNLGVTLGTMVSGFFITRHSVSVTPWIGFAIGFLTVAALVWYIHLSRKQGVSTSNIELPQGH